MEGTFDGAPDGPGVGVGVLEPSGVEELIGPPELGGGIEVPELGGVTGVLEPAELVAVGPKDPELPELDPQANARLDSTVTDAMANARVNARRMGE